MMLPNGQVFGQRVSELSSSQKSLTRSDCDKSNHIPTSLNIIIRAIHDNAERLRSNDFQIQMDLDEF